ncbi:hypothetical protein SAMN02746089_00373 [Caldanaerobius fijiensis DSM 17918]|uniref:PilX N-terminal n=1 Tax=Caldanaerobius fijiensis DSM 17918 TaxID=1121256 RepID=A0A1M4U3S5_9THEO|nr:hypothetical protein [Caldanaerobius fijiensis]SHE51389.1 hypothetical protein SAMN02746089_00373 [Caldanaerobius fijiensis DSM 17918]
MNQKGYSLVSIVIVFFILSLLGLSVLWVTFNQRSKVNRDYDNLSAIYAAESGIEYMKAVINNSIDNNSNNNGNNGNKNNNSGKKENNGNKQNEGNNDNEDILQQTLSGYIDQIEKIEGDKHFIIKGISVLDNSNGNGNNNGKSNGNGNNNGNNGNGNSSYVISIASEGHAGKQVYTAYIKLIVDTHGNSSSLSIETWKIIKGSYKPAIFNNL